MTFNQQSLRWKRSLQRLIYFVILKSLERELQSFHGVAVITDSIASLHHQSQATNIAIHKYPMPTSQLMMMPFSNLNMKSHQLLKWMALILCFLISFTNFNFLHSARKKEFVCEIRIPQPLWQRSHSHGLVHTDIWALNSFEYCKFFRAFSIFICFLLIITYHVHCTCLKLRNNNVWFMWTNCLMKWLRSLNIHCNNERGWLHGLLFIYLGCFLDMDVLIDAQGDMLDSIENQGTSVVDHVQCRNVALNCCCHCPLYASLEELMLCDAWG